MCSFNSMCEYVLPGYAQVTDDVDAVRERLRREIEEKMKGDLSDEAMKKAREEAEAQARRDLEAIAKDSSQTGGQGVMHTAQVWWGWAVTASV